MWLNGSSGTGDKILKNYSHFSCSYTSKDHIKGKTLYHFEWKFDSQRGHMCIEVRNSDGKMSNSSLIDTDNKSSHPFGRPLGLYNDGSLQTVFEKALNSIHVHVNGVYAEGI